MSSISERRRKFVNQEVAIKLRGRHVSKRQLSKVFRSAWRDAKKKIK